MLTKIFKKYKENQSLIDIFNLVSAQVLLRPLQIIKSFFVAKYLGPETFGIVKSVELISMLNKFGNLGFKSVLIRDVTTYNAKGEVLRGNSIKNNAYPAEFCLSFFLLLIGFTISTFFDEKIFIAIILASLGLFSAKLLGMFQTELQINKKFKDLSKIILYQGIFNVIFIILTVPYFNIYAVLSVPVLSAFLMSFYALKFTGMFFKFQINKKELIQILKISIPLSLPTLFYGLFKYVERGLIIGYLGLVSVGIFGFADTIVGIFISILIGSVMKVRGLVVFESLAKGEYLKVHKMIIKETLILVLISLIFVCCIFFTVSYLVPIFLPEWVQAIEITILFSLILPIKIIGSYIAFVIRSPKVNKLKVEPILHLFSSFLLLLFFYFLKTSDQLNLYNFILVDLLVVLIFQILLIICYYRFFYNKLVTI